MKLITILIIVVAIIYILKYLSVENFYDMDSDMLVFSRLDGSLIKKFKIGSSYSLYEDEVLRLFKDDDVIRIQIPPNNNARIIYKFNKGTGYARTLEFPPGSYDLGKNLDSDKTISNIEIKNLFGLNRTPLLNPKSGELIMVKNINGDIIYAGSDDRLIDWDSIYLNYGYDNYYIYYPSGYVKPFIYSYYPRYMHEYPYNYLLNHSWRYGPRRRDNDSPIRPRPRPRVPIRSNMAERGNKVNS